MSNGTGTGDDYDGLFSSVDLGPGPGLGLSALVPPLPLSPAPAPATDDDWSTDPVPVKLEKIRAAFLNAKTAREVTGMASVMAIGDWLDLVIKLSPKQVDVKALQITAVRIELPPTIDGIDGDVIDVEMPH